MPSSPKKLAASRANGAKSKGPVTIQGKAWSSRNALKHGLSAKRLLIPGEAKGEFSQFRDELWTCLNPLNPLEEVLVERIVSCYWKLRRANRIGNEMLEREGDRRRRESMMKSRGINVPLQGEVAWAFEASSGKAFDRLERHEVRLERSALRALHELERLRAGVVPVAIDIDIQSRDEAEDKYREMDEKRPPLKAQPLKELWSDIIK